MFLPNYDKLASLEVNIFYIVWSFLMLFMGGSEFLSIKSPKNETNFTLIFNNLGNFHRNYNFFGLMGLRF